MKVYDILETLASTSKTKEKKAFLEEHWNDPYLKTTVFLALDPNTSYWIRKIPEYEETDNDIGLEPAFRYLNDISSRKVSGNAALDRLSYILSQLSEKDAEVIKRIVLKDLRCGVNVSTVNKIEKNYIPKFPIMKCYGYTEKNSKYISYPAYVQTKMDGLRCALIVVNHTAFLYSSSGKIIDLYGRISQEVLEAFPEGSFVIDGELLLWNKDHTTMLPRTTSNGIYSGVIKGSPFPKEYLDDIVFVVWDVIPYKDFMSKKCVIPYNHRFGCLDTYLISNSMVKVSSEMVNNYDEAYAIFKRNLEAGEEGIILKNKDSPWEDKRVKHQLKFKLEKTADLICDDWKEGNGKYEGMCGSIHCVSSDLAIQVWVSGMSDYMRKSLTEDSILDKIVEVKYNDIIQDKKTGMHSLFLPRINEIRDDKTEADSFEKIVEDFQKK